MRVKQQLDREALPPQLIRNMVPLCMEQYKCVFNISSSITVMYPFAIFHSKVSSINSFCDRPFSDLTLNLLQVFV